jgi:MFS family permease
MLFVFRGLAGVANGGITALSMMIVSDIVTLKERGKWQGILGSCVGAGSMAGPFIAAAFTQPGTWGHTSWRSFFWLVSGLALLAGVVAYFALPTPKNAPPMTFKTVNKEVDWWGILVGSAAIILLLIPISEGGSYFKWESPTVISMLTVGGSCMVGFILIEKYVARLPMIPCKSQILRSTKPCQHGQSHFSSPCQ